MWVSNEHLGKDEKSANVGYIDYSKAFRTGRGSNNTCLFTSIISRFQIKGDQAGEKEQRGYV